MRLAAFKAGGTFSYAGQVTGLDPTITWDAKSSAKAALDICGWSWPALTVSLVPASDYITTHKYDISLYATAAETREWWRTTQMAFDILFFNADDPDPVLITETVYIPILQPITPAPP